eukprot:CAMPEP_0117463678 /NCGR_PEP_ID=MMETSP0784-20121206/3705_1 /TAXON_ID=39447 /ORGANISM="" /LENGTH=245 /DNA_ID=CAMNT_0005257505 /DNA_START=15 /DNA_END=750 /DNA_ORIENTATION=+
MIVYDGVAKMVGPKKEALAQAEADLKAAMTSLAEKKAMLKEVQDNVAKLMADLDAAKAKKEVRGLRETSEDGEEIISGLGGEKDRWTHSSAQLGVQYNNLTGDVLISSGIIAYLGTFLAKYRESSVTSWVNVMRNSNVPSAAEFQLRAVIGEEVVIRQWVIDKLPNDSLSVDNALIMEKSRRWPLMIDPQIQANKWIKNTYTERLKVLRLTTPNYARVLEFAQGDPVLIENIQISLDPVLEPLLQ